MRFELDLISNSILRSLQQVYFIRHVDLVNILLYYVITTHCRQTKAEAIMKYVDYVSDDDKL